MNLAAQALRRYRSQILKAFFRQYPDQLPGTRQNRHRIFGLSGLLSAAMRIKRTAEWDATMITGSNRRFRFRKHAAKSRDPPRSVHHPLADLVSNVFDVEQTLIVAIALIDERVVQMRQSNS